MEKKYTALANDLRRDILAGKYGTEGGLPGLEELVRRSGLARNTVKSALSTLEAEKLIIERDRNYFVNPPVVTTMTQYTLPIAIRMQKYSRMGEIRNTGEVRRLRLPAHLAEKLGLQQPVRVVLQECVSVEIVEGTGETPMQVAQYYYFMPLTDEQVQRMQDHASYDVLLESPEDLVRRDEMFPRLPTNEEIALLRVPPGMPVLNMLSTVFDEDGNILLFQDVTRIPRAVLEYRYSFKNRPKS